MAHFQIWSHGVLLFIQEQMLTAEFNNWSRNAKTKYD